MSIDLDFDYALKHLDRLPAADQQSLLELLDEKERLERLENARHHFIDFVKAVWPEFIMGAHHKIMAEAFDRVANGQLKRLIINMPPRFTKSELSSWLLPAWFLGKFPTKKIIQASNTEGLAAGFGRRVRNLIDGEGERNAAGLTPYQEIFPGLTLAKDSQAAAGWHTNRGGRYFAIGVNGKVTGEGADIAIVDDAHSEQEAKQAENNPEVFDQVYEWFTSGIRQRLQPGGAIIIPMTRWSKRDLTGQVIRKMTEDNVADQWEVIEFPAILEPDEEHPEERSMWPGFWPLEELQRTRASLPVSKWAAQYLQKPTSEEGAILKRDYWREWGEEGKPAPAPHLREAWANNEPPKCEYVIQSWDCAATKNDRSNYSACTTWGIFRTEDPATGKEINNAILLSAFRRRMLFPELKKMAKKFYDEDMPDTLLIENKSAGMQLIQEFRSMGLPVDDFSGSSRGSRLQSNDKIARANAVADIFASGYVWAPRARWAEEVMTECMPRGTFIVTLDGLTDIADIRPGDMVLTHTGRYRPVLRTSKRTAADLWSVQAKTLDTIQLTADHPLYETMANGKKENRPNWVKAPALKARHYRENIRDGEAVLEASNHAHSRLMLPVPVRENPITELDLRDFISMPAGKKMELYEHEGKISTSHFASQAINWLQPLDFDFGWMLGLYIAEGSSSRIATTWSLGSHEGDMVTRLCSIAERFGVRVRRNPPRRSVIKTEVATPLIENFWDGFGHSAHTKKIPAWVWDAPDDFCWGLIRGWADGDGYDWRGKVKVGCVSKQLVWQMRLLMLRLGLTSNIAIWQPKEGRINGRPIYGKPTHTLHWNPEGKTSTGQMNNGVCSYSVLEAKALEGEQEVFNMHVLEDNSYVTTGGIVHNCMEFPSGEYDDYVDTVVQAMMRFRRGGFIGTANDNRDDDDAPRRRRGRAY